MKIQVIVFWVVLQCHVVMWSNTNISEDNAAASIFRVKYCTISLHDATTLKMTELQKLENGSRNQLRCMTGVFPAFICHISLLFR